MSITNLFKEKRPTKDDYFMSIVNCVASRAECPRRKVGAVIVDFRGRILSTGFNGMAPGQEPCIDSPCPGHKEKSGEGLDLCEASHAEISALVTLEKPFDAHTIYVTTAPCIHCVKALLLTSIMTIVFRDDYPINGKELWEKNNRRWMKYSDLKS